MRRMVSRSLRPEHWSGRGSDRFGDDAERLDHEGNFAALGAHDFATGFDDITEVEQVELGEADRAVFGGERLDVLFFEEKLDAAGLVLHMAEGEPALFAPGHEPPGDGGLLAIEILEIAVDFAGVMGAAAFGREGVETHFAQFLRFFHPNVPDFR